MVKQVFRFHSLTILAALFAPTCGTPTGGGTGGTGGSAGSESGICKSDADCRTFSNYCGDCSCLALSTMDPNPVCLGIPKQCSADPCLNKQATCVAGRCQLSTTPTTLKWYLTCGDPVCRGDTPSAGVPLCTSDQKVGESCTIKDQTCDPQSGCNARLVCTDHDPRAVGCPISSRRFKDDIEYVNQQGLEQLARQVDQVKLAHYHYKTETPDKRHLGFIIEDAPNGPAVEKDRDRVDLYGYTSMAVAALQVQSKQLAAQKAELEATRRELADLKRDFASRCGAKAARPAH